MARLSFEAVKLLINQAVNEKWRVLRLPNFGISKLPEYEFGQLVSVEELYLEQNKLSFIPDSIGNLTKLKILDISDNKLENIPSSIGELQSLEELNISNNSLISLPSSIGNLKALKKLNLNHNLLTKLEDPIGELKNLEYLSISNNRLDTIPEAIGGAISLKNLDLQSNQLVTLPDNMGNLINLESILGKGNIIAKLPITLSRLNKLVLFDISIDKRSPALASAYNNGLYSLFSYLRSLEESKPLYEAKLILVGEGNVGKTTLLKALTGQNPQEGEPTTHGISIDIQALYLPHPDDVNIQIQFNAWDFGGQEVYRVTHQFFFSRRSIYLVVWEPRMGVQQCQVEDWLKLIRLRVGDDAKVIIVSTHAKTGQRIARIDKPVFLRDFGSMIVDFIEIDSLIDDPYIPGEKFNIHKLKTLISSAAKNLDQMGMMFNVNWKKVRDHFIMAGNGRPHISFTEFSSVCRVHGLSTIDIRTLAILMHDLGYIVYYADDERLRGDVVLRPEWLTKAIGFVLEDRQTQEMEGILPDVHLKYIWYENPADEKTRFEPYLYPFFLRLMEKYDVSYRLESGTESLVAQHVPQIRPQLPWIPEDREPEPDYRRLAMVCVMEDVPPGLIPWMIVRTHDFEYELEGHRLHWQKGMFLHYKEHGEAMIELRGRELHIYTEAQFYPEFFCNILRQTLQKLINDNWPGLDGNYYFAVPCKNKKPCQGRFRIEALSRFLGKGIHEIPCQVCYEPQNTFELLYGFEDEDPREQLSRIESKIDWGLNSLVEQVDGLESRLSNYVMGIMTAMASEAKDGPRLFDIQPISSNWKEIKIFEARYRLQLWCEAEGCQHPVFDDGKGVYEFTSTREWVQKIAPYAKFIAGMLKTLIPIVAPTVNVVFGQKTIENLGVRDHLDLMDEFVQWLPSEIKVSKTKKLHRQVLSESERSGLIALHALIRRIDPLQLKLGLHRVPTYTGDYLWLCKKHFIEHQSRIPERIE